MKQESLLFYLLYKSSYSLLILIIDVQIIDVQTNKLHKFYIVETKAMKCKWNIEITK